MKADIEVRVKQLSNSRRRLRGALWTCVLSALCLGTSTVRAADYGRVMGSVLDPQGNPLMGATVLIMGPVLSGASSVEPQIERIITDAHGKFTVERLLPGWYSLRVSSVTRLPALRNRIRVEAGQTAQEKFILNDIFAPLRFQAPPANLTTWGDDWKWVLRTSAATRPVLRFQEQVRNTDEKAWKPPLPASQRLIGMTSGSTLREALVGDQGMGSVLAYLRPLSADADLLVAGEMTADGSQASSLATAIRKNIMKGDPEELTLVVHQLSFGDAAPFLPGAGHEGLDQAQALAASYNQTRRISQSVSVTTGIEIDYLNAASGVMTVRPHVKVEYEPNSSNTLALRYGTLSAEDNTTLLERVGVLNAFPQVTLRGNRPRLEEMHHAEVSFSRKMGKTSRAEIAAYRDQFENTAVWGFGGPAVITWLSGDALPNSAVNGVTLNAGNYRSAGVRAAYVRTLGNHVEASVVYASGDALAVKNSETPTQMLPPNLREVLSSTRSQSVAGKVAGLIPKSKTQITTSYQWIERGRVTSLDPYGQATLQLEPFLGIQIRQPLPTLAFFPAHIEALADFRNLLAQGYVPLSRGGEQLILTPAYRSFRGGFSVQF